MGFNDHKPEPLVVVELSDQDRESLEKHARPVVLFGLETAEVESTEPVKAPKAAPDSGFASLKAAGIAHNELRSALIAVGLFTE